MNGVSLNQLYCLRVSCSVTSIVAGCIILGVSSYCGADAVGGIFLGAGALGLIISIFPFIRTWLEYNQILPFLGNMRIHPQQASINPELASVSYTREEPSKQTRPKSIKLPDKKTADTNSPDEGTSADAQQPDIIQKGKFIQPSGE